MKSHTWGVKVESTGGWRRQRARIERIGDQSQVAFDKCVTRMPEHEGKLIRAVL